MSHRRAKRQRSQLVRTGVGVGLALSAYPLAVIAQEQGTSALEEIVVTATRRATALIDVPYNVSAISGAELTDRGVDSLSDLMEQIPGVSFTDAGAKYSRSTGQMIIIR